MKQNNKKRGLLPILFGTLAANTSGNASTGKGVTIAGKGAISAGQNFQFNLVL